jgi:hypothetical protein
MSGQVVGQTKGGRYAHCRKDTEEEGTKEDEEDSGSRGTASCGDPRSPSPTVVSGPKYSSRAEWWPGSAPSNS